MSDTIAQTPPKGAFETMLGLAGVGFLGMCAFVFSYAFYGPQLTAGLDRACAAAAFQSGQKLEKQGNYDQAIQRFRQALDGRFPNPEQRYMCGRSIGELLYRQGRYNEAIAAYQELPEAAFDSAGAYAGYVSALRGAGRLGRAETLTQAWLEKARAQNDRQQETWALNSLMRIAYEEGRLEAALEYGESVVALDPGADARLVLAQIHRDRGEPEKARDQLEAFLKHSDDVRLRDRAQELLDETGAAG